MKVSLTLKRKPRKMEVEAADLHIPDYPWLAGLHATPFIDGRGDVTDLWTVTEKSTGAQLRISPCSNWAILECEVWYWARRHNITERRWKEIISRTKRAIKNI